MKAVVGLVKRHRHPCPCGQKFDRIYVIEIFDQSDKSDDISAGPAAKAVKRTVFGIEGEGRGFFIVEWAKSLGIAPAFFYADIGRHNIFNRISLLKLEKKILVKSHLLSPHFQE